jgi:hypothetical protein
VAFQAPFEIAQSQLRRLHFSSVEAHEVAGGVIPFFDDEGATRFLVIDTTGHERSEQKGGLWVVEEFPLEIRLQKAIYPRPIMNYRPLAEMEAETLSSLYHFDYRSLLRDPALSESSAAALSASNIAARFRGRESLRDLFFTLDLRRLTGGISRSGLFLRRRLEFASLRAFIQETAAARA